eukprot:TRINITY_DN1938_c0_g1_i1.p1 TRINITY_DN1938_c0_g1~~TRINITY_DN1938_c0_g1_i1.p1  ORF type:complete len:371 (+),score=65.71 TRINITY_DN1938_c0_g1_i1:111-1223(+)
MAMDWDAMLEYKTVKIVVIRDRRLGIIHYAVMLLILIYVVVYTIVFEGGYLKTEPPFGSARATLRQPDTLTSETVLPYCLQNSPTSTLSDGSSSPNAQCIFLAGSDIEYPSGIRGYNFGTTRTKDTVYQVDPNCNILPTNSTCLNQNNANTTRTYVADIERYTLFLEHSVYGAQTQVIRQNTQCVGYLLKNGKKIKELPVPREADIFTVQELMDAADVPSLEKKSTLQPVANSLRYDGALFVVVIDYTNSVANAGKYSYTYQIVYIPGLDVVAMEPSVAISANQRYQRTRHGISFVYLITGKIGKFDFATLLQTIISGAVLTNVSGVIVDILLTHVLPQRDTYRPRKYDEGVDSDEQPNPLYKNKDEESK